MLTAGPTAFDYDANGNRVRKTEPLTASGYLSAALNLGWAPTGTVTTRYTYDYENRLTAVRETVAYTATEFFGSVALPVGHISPTMEAEYVYDGYGRRVEKHVTTYITATGVLTALAVFTREYVFDGLAPSRKWNMRTRASPRPCRAPTSTATGAWCNSSAPRT
jgi:YD repeat-containing protein